MASGNVMGKRNPLPESSSSLTGPPSPIRTGKGLRSAADQTLSDYLDKSVKIPELALPEEYIHQNRWVPFPADIEHTSLILSREKEKDSSSSSSSIKRILRSAFELGVFRISGHGIIAAAAASKELESTLSWAEADWIFGDRQEFVLWHPSSSDDDDSDTADWRADKVIGTETNPTFRQLINNTASKLESVAEQLAQVITEGVNTQFSEDNSTNKSVLSLYRYNKHSLMDQDPPISTVTQRIYKSCEYALSLHLIIEQCEFHVQSESCGHLSFNASPDTIVVTVGKQLEEWSHGKFKSANGVLLFEPNDLNKSQSSFSMELKYSLSSFNHMISTPCKKTISIADQILIILIVIFLYKFFGLFGF